MTKQRKSILEVFKTNQHLLSAEMIHELLGENKMDLSTIYRTLELFNQNDLISRSSINNINYYYFNDGLHHHYMICLNCHVMVPIECHLTALENDLNNNHDFKVTHHDMTLYGYCKNCQSEVRV